MARKESHCKLYQQVILRTDVSLNAFGVCLKCLWDIADHENEPPSQSGICFDDSHRCSPFDTCIFILVFGLNSYKTDTVVHTERKSASIQCSTVYNILFPPFINT